MFKNLSNTPLGSRRRAVRQILRMASVCLSLMAASCANNDALRAQVAKDYDCKPEEVRKVTTDYGRGWVTACNGDAAIYNLAKQPDVWQACTGPGTHPTLRKRAAFDLSCEPDKLQ